MVELNTKHGAFGTREYIAWSAAKGRCFNPNDKSRVHYGARGITMCDAWSASFEAFLADMGPCPPGYTLERKDVNGNYEPDNCCWIPAADQSKNRRVVIEARQRRERARAP